jgi:hypothetical protein
LLVGSALGPVSVGLCAAEESVLPEPRIIAVGDVHGSPDALLNVLRAAELVDEEGDWVGGNAILVQTGDLTDRGGGVRGTLDLMRHLERTAAESGGRVVSLLGNHEVFNLTGYYDYQSTPEPIFAEIAAAFAGKDSAKTRKQAYKKWGSWAQDYPGCATASKEEWMARNPIGFIEYQEALSPRGEYGRWLRERPIVVNVQDTLFLHGGLSPELLDMELRSLDSINATAARELAQFDRDRELLDSEGLIPPYPTFGELHCVVTQELQALALETLTESAALRRQQLLEVRKRLPNANNWLLFDPRGPVWFRGYAKWTDEEAEDGLAAVFDAFGGSRIVVGHTPQPGKIVPRFGERIFLIDTAMAYPEFKGRAAALEIRGDRISAIYEGERISLTGEKPAIPDKENSENADQVGPADGRYGTNGREEEAADPSELTENGETGKTGETLSAQRGWQTQEGSPLPFLDEEELLDFLKNARVLEKKSVGKGVTRAKRLVLEMNGIRARAIFHDVNVSRRRHRLGKGAVVMNFRDSYLSNVAAYELGRLLGLTNVPPATVRKLAGKRGSIQLWIENAKDEAERREHRGNHPLSVQVRRRIADMWVFDNLINNIDRNQGNMLYDSVGGFWFIDHTRSFGNSNRLPSPEKMRRCSRSLLAALRNLEEEATQDRLRPYLSIFEIKSLFARRDLVLQHFEEQVASRGEDRVLFSYGDSDDSVAVTYEPSDVPEPQD